MGTDTRSLDQRDRLVGLRSIDIAGQFALKEQASFLRQTNRLVVQRSRPLLRARSLLVADRDWVASPDEAQTINEFGLYGLGGIQWNMEARCHM
jgi:hypothetical protein